jgi:hypothetical protein
VISPWALRRDEVISLLLSHPYFRLVVYRTPESHEKGSYKDRYTAEGVVRSRPEQDGDQSIDDAGTDKHLTSVGQKSGT